MERKSKRRSRPIPDLDAIVNHNHNMNGSNIKKAASKLGEALTHDHSYSCINYYERHPEEVGLIARNGAVHILRCLKVLFHLPPAVFFTATCYLDEFLTRMKVKEKYLSCLTISCLNVSAQSHGYNINASQLVMLSQSKCTVKDMERMSRILKEKLNLGIGDGHHRTPFDLLKVYLDIFKCVATQFKSRALLKRMLKFDRLSIQLEVLISDSSCASFRSSLLALALIQCEIEKSMEKEKIPHKTNPNCYSMEMFYLLAVMIELQHLCMMTSDEYSSCLKIVSTILRDYDEGKYAPQSQNLIWRMCSRRPLLNLKYISALNTIEES